MTTLRRTAGLAGTALALAACAEPPPPDLVQAARVVRSMLRPRQLSRSAFSAGFPEPKPSQFVSYLFSDMGAAEWPPSEATADEMERAQMAARRLPLQPAGVVFVPRVRDPSAGRQLVIGFDDERGVVIAEGWVPGLDAPVLRFEWTLPKVTPAPGVAEQFQSMAELGLSAQAF